MSERSEHQTSGECGDWSLQGTHGLANWELVALCNEFLAQLWTRLVSLVGVSFTAALFSSALTELRHAHPLLFKWMEVSQAGASLNPLIENPRSLDPAALRLGMVEFANGLVALLGDLTGEILVDKVESLVHQFNDRLKEE